MFAKQGGEFDYVQPNLGYGNALAGLGASVSSAFKGMGAQQAYANRNNPQQQQGGFLSGFAGTGGGSSNNYYQGNENYDSSY